MQATSLGLKKPEDTDTADLRVYVGDNMDMLNTLLLKGFKRGTGTFTAGGASHVFADSDCTVNSLVIIVITAAIAPKGIWSVDSAAGSFTIASEVSETADIAFDYYIEKSVA